MATEQMVFNDNYWGPVRERSPELEAAQLRVANDRNAEPTLRIDTQTGTPPLTYSHTIGRGEQTGMGFRFPIDLTINPRTGYIYVANRSYEYRIELKRISMLTIDEEFLGQFSNGGEGEGDIYWPRSLAVDQDDNVYLSDEHLQKISIWTEDGEYLGRWGVEGSGDGEFNKPAGIAFNSQNHLFVVDGSNHRIEKFTKDGQFLAKFGSFGSGDGQFNLPWGIEIDSQDNIYIADWRNDRIQKFSPEGDFLMKFGTSGSEGGEFKRPTGVAVDKDGDIYVTDWDNNRLQMFDSSGSYLHSFLGDATLSKWGIAKLDSNDYMWNEREAAWGLEREKYFWHPIAVDIDPEGRILVLEPFRTRIQVYTKNR